MSARPSAASVRATVSGRMAPKRIVAAPLPRKAKDHPTGQQRTAMLIAAALACCAAIVNLVAASVGLGEGVSLPVPVQPLAWLGSLDARYRLAATCWAVVGSIVITLQRRSIGRGPFAQASDALAGALSVAVVAATALLVAGLALALLGGLAALS